MQSKPGAQRRPQPSACSEETSGVGIAAKTSHQGPVQGAGRWVFPRVIHCGAAFGPAGLPALPRANVSLAFKLQPGQSIWAQGRSLHVLLACPLTFFSDQFKYHLSETFSY